MAHLVPADLTRVALAGAHDPELAVLADALPDEYTVFLTGSVMATTRILVIPGNVSWARIVGTRLRGSS
jgi:hypothetical protein